MSTALRGGGQQHHIDKHTGSGLLDQGGVHRPQGGGQQHHIDKHTGQWSPGSRRCPPPSGGGGQQHHGNKHTGQWSPGSRRCQPPSGGGGGDNNIVEINIQVSGLLDQAFQPSEVFYKEKTLYKKEFVKRGQI